MVGLGATLHVFTCSNKDVDGQPAPAMTVYS
jgi:hypothetical protein